MADGLRPIVVIPTGGGKTVCAASIIERELKRTPSARIAFTVPRRELIEQTCRKLSDWGVDHGVIWAQDYRRLDYRKQVQVCSVQTLVNRLDLDLGFTHIMPDECHHMPAETWKVIAAAFPGAHTCGFTATPDGRADGKRLGEMFDVLIKGATVKGLIADGFLVQPRYIVFESHNLERFKDDAEAGQEAKIIAGNVVQEWIRHGRGRPSVAFCYDVAHAQDLTARFRQAGVRAECVWGDMDDAERKAILGDGERPGRIETGETEIICSVQVVDEGFDCPPLSCAIFARHCGAIGSYVQRGGRVLRPYKGKRDCLILDHGGNFRSHGRLEDDREIELHDDPYKAMAVREAGEKGDFKRVRQILEDVDSRAIHIGVEPLMFSSFDPGPQVITIPKPSRRPPFRKLRG
jgi:superfamily II DNA or RNA helicase